MKPNLFRNDLLDLPSGTFNFQEVIPEQIWHYFRFQALRRERIAESSKLGLPDVSLTHIISSRPLPVTSANFTWNCPFLSIPGPARTFLVYHKSGVSNAKIWQPARILGAKVLHAW